jgi:DNA polymerase-3 subunit alpha
MGKKIKEEMDAQRALFVDGATAKGVEKNTASFIFDQVAKFAGYGFNKSHAAAYALIAYQTAWLKANYPAEFLAATMTYELGNTDKLGLFRQEALRMNLSVLPPDVNTSKRYFAVESDGKALRYALTAIKGIGEAPVLELVTEREKNGAYTGLYDFTKRLAGRGLNKRFLENMCYAGAFDSLHQSRAAVFANIETAVASGVSSKADDDSGQESLFGITSLAPAVAPKFIDHPEWSPLEKLGNEFTALGLYLSAHPMDSYQLALDKMKVTLAKDVAEIVGSKGAQRLTMAGIVTAKKERKSAKGNRFAFVQFSDTSGVFEVMMFSEVLALSRELLEQNVPLLVSVDATEEGEGYRLLAQMIRPLDGVAADVGLGIELTINEEKTLSILHDILAQEPRGNAQVLLKLPSTTGHLVTITLPQRYALSMTTRQKVKGLAGVKSARDVV